MAKKLGLLLTLVFAATGCQTVYNAALENVFHVEKRKIFKSSIQDVSASQKKAQEVFKDSITRLKELYNFNGGNLEVVYNKLKASYEGSEAQANKVHDRIANMEDVAKSMFAEWNKEIGTYSNQTFAADSRRQLEDTQSRFAQLDKSVRDSEASMKPVLTQLRDHVLYLKHNLNAESIGTLKSEAVSIQGQIEGLIDHMNSSIAEADGFIQTMTR